jgi:hypothetical protein
MEDVQVHSKHREVKEKTGRDKNLGASERVLRWLAKMIDSMAIRLQA